MLLEFTIHKTNFKFNCEEDEQEKLLDLIAKIDRRVSALGAQLTTADEKTLLAIALITTQEELDAAKAHEDDDQNPTLSEQDVYDAVSENMENLADHIEKLTKKIRDY